MIEIPHDAFSRPGTAVQILSYRTEALEGPAVSAVVRPAHDPTGWRHRPHTVRAPRVDLAGSVDVSAPPVDRGVSTAMFLDSVVTAIAQLLPALSQLLPGVARLGGTFVPQAAGAAAPTGPSAGRPAGPPAPAAPATSAGGAVSDLGALLARPETAQLLQLLAEQVRNLTGARTLVTGQSYPGGPTYAEAKALPAALLAALPALMPLLQNVLSPQTIQSVLQTADPNRLLATITAGLGDLAKIGLQADQAQMEHLERLNPGLGDDLAERLLTSMTLRERRMRAEPDYRRSEQVSIAFVGLEPVTPMGGEPVVAFSASAPWHFTITAEIGRPIPSALLTLRVEERMSRRSRFERRTEVAVTGSGTLATVTVPVPVVSSLPLGTEYHVRATLTWPGRDGSWGTSRVLLLRVPGPVTAGGIHRDGELSALDDITNHRPFWHRVWAEDFSRDMRRAELRLRYVYRFDPEVVGTVREPTRMAVQTAEGRWKLTASLVSGLRLGIDAVDDLAWRLTGARLDPAVLAACAGIPAHELGGTAQATVSLRGRPGDQGAIWVWPEVRWHRITLHRPGDVMPTGQVRSFTEDEVRLAFPALAHVLGASS
ncbi:hypothetical protein [Ornithinimicrobium sufpigmenti]|uniref:hypothetical protein n=1 Tax=Ornithinimicrobium sufpigmenti TaxID=2508882 RepID=UPI0010362B15|nr:MULTISPECIES: hypothetical protein [unclassified Ornithinimicrobium]